MDERDVLAERFDAERGRLRLVRSDEAAIENLSGS